MSETKSVNVNFTGPGTLLTVVFVILKALGYISWSWWWVFAPLWIPLVLVIGLVLVAFIVAVFAAVCE